MTKEYPQLADELSEKICEQISIARKNNAGEAISVKGALIKVKPWVIENAQHLYDITESAVEPDDDIEYYKNVMVNYVLCTIASKWKSFFNLDISENNPNLGTIRVSHKEIKENIKVGLHDLFALEFFSIADTAKRITDLELNYSWDLVNESNRIKTAKNKEEDFIESFIENTKNMLKAHANEHYSGDIRKIPTTFDRDMEPKIIELLTKTGYHINGILEHICQEFTADNPSIYNPSEAAQRNARKYKKLYASAIAIMITSNINETLDMFLDAIEKLDSRHLLAHYTYQLSIILLGRFELAEIYG